MTTQEPVIPPPPRRRRGPRLRRFAVLDLQIFPNGKDDPERVFLMTEQRNPGPLRDAQLLPPAAATSERESAPAAETSTPSTSRNSTPANGTKR